MTEVVTAETATDKVLPLDRRLRAAKGALILAEHKRREWWHDAGPNVTQDHIRHPDYWAMLAPQLIRHDLITVLSVDQSWEALLCVERVRQDGADVSVRKIASRTTIVSAGQVSNQTGAQGRDRLVLRGERGERIVNPRAIGELEGLVVAPETFPEDGKVEHLDAHRDLSTRVWHDREMGKWANGTAAFTTVGP